MDRAHLGLLFSVQAMVGKGRSMCGSCSAAIFHRNGYLLGAGFTGPGQTQAYASIWKPERSATR
ncbi:MAG: hypothetical protein ACLSTO_06800 [Bilophila wadsworthia]